MAVLSCETTAVTANPNPPIVAVVGATASGKTELSLDLAEALGGEIVNTDAMQVYRGMDIGTAKVPVAQRRGIAHHEVDVLSVADPATVAEFQERARGMIAELRAGGVTPVLVGGSALYVRALLDIFEFPGHDPELRARLEASTDDLHARLAETDPVAASRILPSNRRRLVRALEVIEITGRPFSAALPDLTYRDPRTIQIGVDIPRDVLLDRIEVRVHEMFASGLLPEVERLVDEGLLESRTASRAIGYREAAAHLAGELSLQDAIDRTVVATRRFARRQDQWFRKDPRIVWVPWDAPDRVERALTAVAGLPA